MDNLVLSNILFRKTRAALSVAGVALGVVLVLLTVGIAHGFLNEQGKRNSAVTAEIWVRPPGDLLAINSTLQMRVSEGEQIKSIDGVAHVIPVGILVKGGRQINGIEFDSFKHASDITIVEGREIRAGDEVIIDLFLQRSRNLKVGETMDVFDRPFTIVGIYDPETLGRLKVPLSTMQQYLSREGLCSRLLVKVTDPARQEEVAAAIKQRLPGSAIELTRDMPILYARGTPALNTFLNVVITLAVVVSSLVILLAMYTTVTERTRQIGVLKSLGASRSWIAGEIEKEALLISFVGVLVGVGLAVTGKYIIQGMSTISVELETVWLFYSLLIGMSAGALGALYPALRAANQDPVKALAYE